MKPEFFKKIWRYALWFFPAIAILMAFILVSYFSPYVPDYDGLGYFETARILHKALLQESSFAIWIEHAQQYTYIIPITNGLSVVLAAISFDLLDRNLLPVIINSLYIIVFTLFLSRLRTPIYVALAVVLLLSNTLFFRLFTTLTSEFPVGLWMFGLFTVLLTEFRQRSIALATLVIVGILLRTVDIVFICFAVGAYTTIHYCLYRNWQHVWITLRVVILTIGITLLIFWNHYLVAYHYVYAVSTGITATSWKSLAGVDGHLDVVKRYAEYLILYNRLVFLSLLAFTLLPLIRRDTARRVALIFATAFSPCIPLFLASSLNIQTVFWIYVCIVFFICESFQVLEMPSISIFPHSRNLHNLGQIPLGLGCITFFFIFILKSWAYELPYLRQQKSLSEISQEIASVFEDTQEKPVIVTNFRGVGSLDLLGLSWWRPNTIGYGGIEDIYSKNISPEDYLKLSPVTNFFIAAKDNYFWPPHFGINLLVQPIYSLFNEKSSELGFKKIKAISKRGHIFDIWYRPSATVHLQYSDYKDYWISNSVPVTIGSPTLCGESLVSGDLNISILIPNPPAPNFAPPFVATIEEIDSQKMVSRFVVDRYGQVTMSFKIDGVRCGDFSLKFDKSFQASPDPRYLSAMLEKSESSLKFSQKQHLN